MINVTYDKLRKIGHCEIITDIPIDEAIIAGTRNVIGFAVDVGGEERNFGHDAYFKAYKLTKDWSTGPDNLCARIYYTRPVYFKHTRELKRTKLWELSSKDKKLIYNTLSSTIINHFKHINGLPDRFIVTDPSITTYQFLIYMFDLLANDFQISRDFILNSRGAIVENKFISIDYPMPDYRQLVLRK